MRIVFAGTPDVAVTALDALHAAGHDIRLVITREDAPVGRKRVLTQSPVATRAAELGLPLLKMNQLTSEVEHQIERERPDLGVVVAYGGFLREPLLSMPRFGWINLHFSSLPKWRGAAPVQRALMAGERNLGITVFRLDEGMDSGPILAQSEVIFPDDVAAGHCLTELARLGSAQINSVLAALETGSAATREQIGTPTFAPKLTRADGRIDWTDSAQEIRDRWAGVTPEPGAFSELDGNVVKILELKIPNAHGGSHVTSAHSEVALAPGAVAQVNSRVLIGTGTVPIQLLTIQPAGKQAMAASDWLRGRNGAATLR